MSVVNENASPVEVLNGVESLDAVVGGTITAVAPYNPGEEYLGVILSVQKDNISYNVSISATYSEEGYEGDPAVTMETVVN